MKVLQLKIRRKFVSEITTKNLLMKNQKFIIRKNAFQLACDSSENYVSNLKNPDWKLEIISKIILSENQVSKAKKLRVRWRLLLNKLSDAKDNNWLDS